MLYLKLDFDQDCQRNDSERLMSLYEKAVALALHVRYRASGVIDITPTSIYNKNMATKKISTSSARPKAAKKTGGRTASNAEFERASKLVLRRNAKMFKELADHDKGR